MAHLVFGSVAGGIPVLTIIDSETVAAGAVSGAAPNGASVVRVNGTDVDVYAAIGGAGADASTDPREYIPVGAWKDLAIAPGQFVSIEAA